MLKEIGRFFDLPNEPFSIFVLYVWRVEDKWWTFLFPIQIMDNLIGAIGKRVNRNGIAFIEPKADSRVELSSRGLQLRDFDPRHFRAIRRSMADRKEAFDCVGMHVVAHVLFQAVRDGVVGLGYRAKDAVLARVIGHQVRPGAHVRLHDRFQGFRADVRNVERTNFAATLDQRENRMLVRESAFGPATVLAPLKGFIGFNRSAARPEQARSLAVPVHRFAQAMGHEPRRFVGHAEHALYLLTADTLFARRHQSGGKQPLVQGNLGTLEYRSDRYRELVAAMAAVIKAGTMRLARQLADAIHSATMRAYRTFGPAHGFKVLAGGFWIVKAGFVEQVVGHDVFPMYG